MKKRKRVDGESFDGCPTKKRRKKKNSEASSTTPTREVLEMVLCKRPLRWWSFNEIVNEAMMLQVAGVVILSFTITVSQEVEYHLKQLELDRVIYKKRREDDRQRFMYAPTALSIPTSEDLFRQKHDRNKRFSHHFKNTPRPAPRPTRQRGKFSRSIGFDPSTKEPVSRQQLHEKRPLEKPGDVLRSSPIADNLIKLLEQKKAERKQTMRDLEGMRSELNNVTESLSFLDKEIEEIEKMERECSIDDSSEVFDHSTVKKLKEDSEPLFELY